MGELLNGIFECLDINSSTGLATEDSLQSMTSTLISNFFN